MLTGDLDTPQDAIHQYLAMHDAKCRLHKSLAALGDYDAQNVLCTNCYHDSG